jgi:hypothetical protein
VRAGRASLTLRWLPAVAGAAYVLTVAVLGTRLVEDNDWDSDVSAPFALAEQLRGSGSVHIPHYGEWTTFWWLLATRWLPWHASIWDASGYMLAVATAALLGLATSRVAGKWAGVTAGATALLVGPFALRALLSVASHVTNPVGAVVLATALVLLPRTRSWVLVVVVGVVAGTNAASDGLLWFAGVIPFAFAAGLYARSTQRRDIAVRAGAIVGVTIVSAVVTTLVMRALDFRVLGLDVGLDSVHDWPSNVRHLVRMIALLGGANYAIPGAYPHEPLRALVAILWIAGIASPVVAAIRLRHTDSTLRTYATFWAAAVVCLCAVFVVTPNATDLGPKAANYLLALAPAAGVGIALLAMHARAAQLAVALAVCVVATVNIGSIAAGRAEITDLPAITAHWQDVQRVLEREGVTRGYAGYWDSHNLSWQTHMRLRVAPVVNCAKTLCPYNFFTIRSWYQEKSGPTFLLIDPTNGVVRAPPFVSDAKSTQRLGPLTLYVFRDDIAMHFRVIAPSESSGTLRRFSESPGKETP